jgi:hypothetical protein
MKTKALKFWIHFLSIVAIISLLPEKLFQQVGKKVHAIIKNTHVSNILPLAAAIQ